ncbi:MAG: glycoside hydrolase family 2 protein [Clostridia bacterium]|nr:glycoside hydrolase family 2 protein [Clostridia bacterium]
MLNRIYLNDHWCYSHEDQPEKTEIVRLPHNNQDLPFHYFDETLYQFISVYERDISIPAEWKGQNVSILFEGVAHQCDVYCNDVLVGSHACGYTQFRVPITEQVQYGETAHLKVVVDSRETLDIPPFGHVIDYLTYGGIYREVILEATGPVSLEKTFVHGLDVYSTDKTFQVDFTVTSTVALQNRPLNVDLFVFDGTTCILSLEDQRAVIGPNSFQLHSDQLKIWDLSTPNLYTLKIRLSLDGIPSDTDEVTFGLRDAVFKRDGFYLNGKCMKLRGLDRHQSFPYVGYAMPQSMQEEDARTLKYRLGLNAVRTSHYPQSKYFLDECDRLGLLVFTEAPGWQHIGEGSWKDQHIQNIREMILDDWNHPSIILWGVRINESLDDDELYQRANDVAHALDPTRQTSGVRYLKHSRLLEDVYAFNDFSHTGDNAGITRKELVTTKLTKPYLISEHNGHMFPTKSFDDEPHRLSQALRHARVVDDALAPKNGVSGVFGWCMADYNTHKDFGSGDKICYHGVLDMFRNPKLAAALYESQGEDHDVLEISSSMDIGEHPGGFLGDVVVFTNADHVDLYKNGEFVLRFDPDTRHYPNLPHPPVVIDDLIGELMEKQEGLSPESSRLIRKIAHDYLCGGTQAVITPSNIAALGYTAVKDKLTVSRANELVNQYVTNWGSDMTVYRFDAIKDDKVVKTVEKLPVNEFQLKVVTSHTDLHEKTTYDVASVRIEAVSGEGNHLPYASDPVTLTVEGALELIGPSVVPLRGGFAGTYVKSTGTAGAGRLTIHCDRCEDLVIDYNSSVDEGYQRQ